LTIEFYLQAIKFNKLTFIKSTLRLPAVKLGLALDQDFSESFDPGSFKTEGLGRAAWPMEVLWNKPLFDVLVKSNGLPFFVIPAKAGIQEILLLVDSCCSSSR
jgi:hypothetical protein